MDTFQNGSVVACAEAIPHPNLAETAALRRPPSTVRTAPQRLIYSVPQGWRLIVLVFLPFAAGFYLSYLFRSINALISNDLTSALAIGAADLGLLTSVLLLTFAAAQVPIGVLLDRYGPRRVQSSLLLVAAAGAAIFATAEGFATLVLARGLIGLGVAAALMAGLKATVLWFPKERVALVNGYMVMFGALGAVTATASAEMLIASTGWRGLFELLALATAVSAIVIYLVVPEVCSTVRASKESALAGLKKIYADPRFWKLAPVSATCIGTAWALQGLWAAPWLSDVDGVDRSGLVQHLFVMAVALSAGAVLLGTMADRLARRGMRLQTMLAAVAAASIAAQLALILRLPVSSYLLWSVVAVVGAGTVLSYAIVAEYFPKELAGRANGALNVFHFGGAFALQYAIGLILEQWTPHNGRYPAIAYQIAFGVNVALQLAALAWFGRHQIRSFLKLAAKLPGQSPAWSCNTLQLRAPYRQAAGIWADRLDDTRDKPQNWRLAALGSTIVPALLSLALAISIGGATATPYVLDLRRLDALRVHQATTNAYPPSDAQIAYFLGHFIRNVRSLSLDPIVVRANRTNTLDYVTAPLARSLYDYADNGNPFTKERARSVAVDVIAIERFSKNSFELRWKEEVYERGRIVGTQHFTGFAGIILKPSAESSKNPLGLYVHALNWSRDIARDDK
jgi:type IV secretory pathway TrbF-like protein/sugar phosphate permease